MGIDGLLKEQGLRRSPTSREAPPSPRFGRLKHSRQIRQLANPLSNRAGEWRISNLRWRSSGHCYFSLKDAGAQLSCVLFRGEGFLQDPIAQGVRLILSGDVSVYMQRGQYQMIVRGLSWMASVRCKWLLNASGSFRRRVVRCLQKSSLSLSGNHRPGDIREWGCLEGRDACAQTPSPGAQGATGRLPVQGGSWQIARSIID